jgi:hypothetical protein
MLLIMHWQAKHIFHGTFCISAKQISRICFCTCAYKLKQLFYMIFCTCPCICKVKCTLVRALRLCTVRTAYRGSRGIALPFLETRHQKGVRDQRQALAAIYPQERHGTHFTAGWVGPRAGLDRCGKSRPPTGFDSRTVQPVASRYNDWATRPTRSCIQQILFSVCLYSCT